ncbi:MULTISPECIES: DUF6607 family protein [unclassified Polaribacter]|uniref:DUF6607 family protein n=1 Tax=unclassified Polaribacter TaxID=196858 RepID=UPI001C4E7904|nr:MULTISPECIES: DUF6607 family protein [unclassified Polaribacter]QXP67449.1 hypothetical protein H0I28_02825 [Polaribacter sp. AHE13PA]QXP69609.1 hypothetical protein H0I29_13420 [Polaribacter sp. R2A056_3_33]
MNKLLLSTLLLFLSISVNAQSKKKKDQNAIKEMCGCFEVTFNFAETFNYSKDSTYKPSKTKVDKGLEWAGLVEDSNNKISIQHLLQVGNPKDPMIIKHWRQDWLYENNDFYMYNGDNNWTFEQKSKSDVKKQWTQKVYQVDDSPRYEGSGTWVHVDGKSYWENETTAPLPRREYTKRSDYNITLRGNRHEITSYGWLHDQDNSKIIREAGKEDVVLAKEKGYNTYVKVDDSKCKAASDWWKANNNKWQLVRNKWNEVYGRNTNLSLETKVEFKELYKHLFSDETTKEKEINTIIESFVKK